MIPGAPAPQPAAPGGAPMPAPAPRPALAGPPQPGAAPAAPMPVAPPPPQAPPLAAVGVPTVFDIQTFEAAVALLENDRLRGFRADIETASTIAADEQMERQAAAELMQTLGAFFQSSMPLAQSMPGVLPILGQMMLFLFRRHHVGVELEGKLEDAIAKLEGNPGGAMMNPKTAEIQAKQQQEAAKTQAELQRTQMAAQAEQAAHSMDLERQGIQLQTERMRAGVEAQRLVMEEQQAQADHAREMQAMHTQAALGLGGGAPLAPQKLAFGAGAMTRGDK